MAALATRLPLLTAGAAARIWKFETETSGDVLALGDIQAIISRAHVSTKAIELERLTRIDELPDRTFFDTYRNLFWRSLKKLYPPDKSKVGIAGLTIASGESIFAYVDRAEGLWADKNDCHPHGSALAIEVFQKAILKGL